MNALQFLVDHGASVLFWVVFVEQAGLPIPALPLLIAAGVAEKKTIVPWWNNYALHFTFV